MVAHEDTRRIQILSVSDTGRRRWTDDEKIRIVEESYGDGVTVAEVARRQDVSRSLLCDWRYSHKHGMLVAGPQFLRLLPVEDSSGSDDAPAPQSPEMATDLGLRRHLKIPSGFDVKAAARLLNGLMVCQSALNFDPLSASNIDPFCAEQARCCVAFI